MSVKFNNYPIIFTHVPRSAGTTLVNIMSRHYPSREQFFFYVREKSGNIDMALEEFKRLSDEDKNKLKLLQGHTSFGIHTYYPAYTYITLLRDPTERVLSYYYYIVNRKDHYLHNLVLNNKMRLEDFVTSGISAELDNIQVRQLSGMTKTLIGKCTEAMLNTAKSNLLNQYAVFGITERFDESIILMKRHFNWQYPFYYKMNTISNKPLKEQLSLSTRRAIEKYNGLDVELYNFATGKFQEIVEQQNGTYQQELNNFMRYNAMMQKISRPYTGNLGFTLWNAYAKLRR